MTIPNCPINNSYSMKFSPQKGEENRPPYAHAPGGRFKPILCCKAKSMLTLKDFRV